MKMKMRANVIDYTVEVKIEDDDGNEVFIVATPIPGEKWFDTYELEADAEIKLSRFLSRKMMIEEAKKYPLSSVDELLTSNSQESVKKASGKVMAKYASAIEGLKDR